MTNNFARGFASSPPDAPRPVERGPNAELRDVRALLLLPVLAGLEPAAASPRRGIAAGGWGSSEEVDGAVGEGAPNRLGDRGCMRRSVLVPLA